VAPGAILRCHVLCFDELAPEITSGRLVVVFDHRLQADRVRYSEPPIMVGESDENSPRGRAIREYQNDLIRRCTA
jgi:hypothetical protein